MTTSVPPHDLDAEAAVLSAIMLEAGAINAVVGLVRPEHFYSESNRWICEAAYDLSAKGKGVDVVTIAGWLRDKDRMNQIGGSTYLAQLVDAVPFVANLTEYVGIIVRKASIRRMIATCQTIAAEGYGQAGATDDFLARAAGAVDRVAREARGSNVTAVYSERDLFVDVAKAMMAGEPVKRCTTGIPDLDRDIGGHVAGMVTWLGGSTGWGKSSFAVMSYDEIVRSGKRVLLVSCEDPKDLFARRILARRAHVSAYGLRERTLLPDAFARVLGVAEMAAAVPMFVDGRGQPVEEIASRIAHICKHEPIDLVMVDYLQAISTTRRFEDKRLEMTFVARTLTDAIKGTDTGAAGLIFSQIKRLEAGRVPTKHDLKESGDIENMSENVLMGYVNKEGKKVMRLDKAKDAEKNDYLMGWDPLSCSFTGARRIEERT